MVISDLPMALVWVCRRWLPFPSERRTVVSGWCHSCVVPLAHIACAHLDHTLYVCMWRGRRRRGNKDDMHTKGIYIFLISSPLNTLFLPLPPVVPSLYPSSLPPSTYLRTWGLAWTGHTAESHNGCRMSASCSYVPWSDAVHWCWSARTHYTGKWDRMKIWHGVQPLRFRITRCLDWLPG